MAPVVSVSPVVHGVCGTSISCRLVLWLQYLLHCRLWLQSQYLLSRPVAPVSVVRGSSRSICCRSWLQSPVSVVCDSSLQYLSPFVASSVARPGCRSWLQWLQEAVARSCLQYHYLLSLVAPVVVACGSSICRLWLQCLSFVAPVSVDCLWLQYPSVVRGSGISSCGCRSWLLWLSSCPVALVSVVGVSSTTICCLWLL